MRNPFIKIGKVFKYEVKSSSRIFLPLYGVLCVVALLLGLSGLQKPKSEKLPLGITNVSYMNEQSPSSTFENFSIQVSSVKSALIFLYGALIIAIIVLTIALLIKRFRKSMLGDEAYLNLSLPVTISEHLWGRILASLMWAFLCFITIFVSVFLTSFDPSIYKQLIISLSNGLNISKGEVILVLILMYSFSSIFLILFCYCIESITHLFASHHSLAKACTTIVLLIVTSKFSNIVLDLTRNIRMDSFYANFWTAILSLIFISACFYTAIYFIFKKGLNL